jgi:hypothetical protein
VSGEVADQFAATQGMCDERDVLQIELLHHSAEIVGQSIEFVANRGFNGRSTAPSIQRYLGSFGKSSTERGNFV